MLFSDGNFKHGAVGLALTVCVLLATLVNVKRMTGGEMPVETPVGILGGIATDGQSSETLTDGQLDALLSNIQSDTILPDEQLNVTAPDEWLDETSKEPTEGAEQAENGEQAVEGSAVEGSLPVVMEIKSADLSGVGVVTVYFDVVDENGNPITDLSAEGVSVTLGGQDRAVTNFAHVVQNYFRLEFVPPQEDAGQWLELKITVNSSDYAGTATGTYLNSGVRRR
jgi:hypothetical protein